MYIARQEEEARQAELQSFEEAKRAEVCVYMHAHKAAHVHAPFAYTHTYIRSHMRAHINA